MTFGNGSKTVRILKAAAIAALLLSANTGQAEPYLAVYKGMQCSACHSHPAGGGKRSVYGNAFAQVEMPAAQVATDAGLWTGDISDWLAIGANLRADYRHIDTPNQPESSRFDVSRGTIYIEANVIPNRLSVYVDQQLAPSGSLNREAYVKLRSASKQWHLAAGQFYLPYGLRLQDDTAFVRQATGINFTNPDRGVQLGYESGPWSAIASVTNGTGGGSEVDTGKQFSLVTSYVKARWRAGVSFNVNDADAGDRQMQGVFAGARIGDIVWLAEVDWISDDEPGLPSRDAIAGLIEANWMFRRGHNLKLGYDYLDPDRDLSEDHQVRWSAVYEYTPIQFIQGRFGVRVYDGIPQDDRQNRDEFFVELHGFF